MPYSIRNNCVYQGSQKLKCYNNHADALKYLRALEANVPDAKELEKAKNPDNFAVVPDESKPSTWKLDISDDTHIADAITAMTSGFRGNKVELTSEERAQAKKRIRAAINKMPDGDKKQNLLDRLGKVKSVEKAYTGLLPQDEVNYITVSSSKGKMCANCRWFIASGTFGDDGDGDNDCHLICEYPQPILPTGLCDRWEAIPAPPEPQAPEPIPAYLVEPPAQDDMDDGSYMLSSVREGRQQNRYNVDRIKKIYAEVKAMMEDAGISLEDKARKLLNKPDPNAPFRIFKTGDNYYWIARHTNNFEDLDGEILSEKSHDDYIARVDMGIVPTPELWIWHTEGTRLGQADTLFREGHFVYAVGHFDDTPQAQKAISYFEKAYDLGLSHGFTAPEWAFKDGVYDRYNTFEISVLPNKAAANPYTSFEEIKMAGLTPDKLALIEQIGGKELADSVKAKVSDGAERGKELEALNAKYKDAPNVTKDTDGQKEMNLKAVGELLVDNIERQGELETIIVGQEKAIEGYKTALQDVTKELKDLKKLVNQGPRSAAHDDETITDDKEAEDALEKIKELSPVEKMLKATGAPLKKENNKHGD